jgi:hypothetical protein
VLPACVFRRTARMCVGRNLTAGIMYSGNITYLIQSMKNLSLGKTDETALTFVEPVITSSPISETSIFLAYFPSLMLQLPRAAADYLPCCLDCLQPTELHSATPKSCCRLPPLLPGLSCTVQLTQASSSDLLTSDMHHAEASLSSKH